GLPTSDEAVVRLLEHHAVYTDSSEVLHLDMDTVTSNGLKDASCAATADSRNGQGTGMGGTGTLNTIGIDGSARDFRGPGWSDYLRVSNAPALNPTSFTIAFW